LFYSGNNVFEITEAAGVTKGVYMLRIVTAAQTQTIKIVKGN
jgi:hypothetical protein